MALGFGEYCKFFIFFTTLLVTRSPSLQSGAALVPGDSRSAQKGTGNSAWTQSIFSILELLLKASK